MGEHLLFGDALREQRERTSPATVGLRVAGPRRARGLRREELADLAGVSADYIRRLEQGRSHPSAGVVTSLARALGANRAEYENLCALAGHAPADGRVPRDVHPGTRRLLERLDGTAVCICDAAWTAIAWNGEWEALQCGERTSHVWDRNLAWRAFRQDDGRVRRSAERRANFEAMLATELRSASLRYPADDGLAALIDDLRSTSRSFSTLWSKGSTVAHHDDRATVRHPEGGDITLDCDVLAVRDGDLRAMIFTAQPGSDDAGRLREVVGGPKASAGFRVGQIGPG
jgi:transcriptional regulator with XRE-family HTH domain